MKNVSSKAPQVEVEKGLNRFQQLCCIAGAMLVSATLVGEYIYTTLQKAPIPPIH